MEEECQIDHQFLDKMKITRPNQYNEPRSGQSSNNLDFLGNWPTPAETIQQQTMKRLIGMIERMDVRMEKMESQHMTRWSRYNP